jgi:hypothetical protein
MIVIDLVVLFAWTYSSDRPQATLVQTRYSDVIASVQDQICSTDRISIYEWLLVAYKIAIVAAGIQKSVKTRNVSAEYSEAKHFAVALYVIGIVGAVAYALRYFINFSPEVLVFIRCLGIFLCSNVAIFFVMGPKLSSSINIMMGGEVEVGPTKGDN